MTISIKSRVIAIILSVMALIIVSVDVYANNTQPKFTIIPHSSSTVTVGNTGTAQITYIVTNKLPTQETLTMTAVNGITQDTTTSADACKNPMVLNPGARCLLILSISGNQFPANQTTTVSKSPQVCIGTSKLSCSQPSNADWLKIKTVTAYVTIGGTVKGLAVSGLVLKNGGESFHVPPTQINPQTYFHIPNKTNYDVIISANTTGLICTIDNPTGRATGNVINIDITCSSAPPVTIGGTVTGLSLTGLVLKNGGTYFEVPANPDNPQTYFKVPMGSPYNVEIFTQPDGFTCTISNYAGTATANVTTVNILCDNITVTISGTVAGLNVSGLQLKNGGQKFSVPANPDNPQTYFKVPMGSPYNVEIFTQPDGFTCTISNNAGTATANVTGVNISCTCNGPFTVTPSTSGDFVGTVTPRQPQSVNCSGQTTFTVGCFYDNPPTLDSSSTCIGSFNYQAQFSRFTTEPITADCNVVFFCPGGIQ